MTRKEKAYTITVCAFFVLLYVFSSFQLALRLIPSCDSESPTQTICYWNAETQGNGEGNDFYKFCNIYILIGGL